MTEPLPSPRLRGEDHEASMPREEPIDDGDPDDGALAAQAELFCNVLTEAEMTRIAGSLGQRARELFGELYLACAERFARRQAQRRR